MKSIEEFKEEYKIGQEIFEELFKLKDKDLKLKLIELLKYENKVHLIGIIENAKIIRTIEDETPKNIKLNFYNKLVIDWSGVKYINKYNTVESVILKFDKFFNVEYIKKLSNENSNNR